MERDFEDYRPATNILDLIGSTPMVRIRNLNPYGNVTILAKLEGFNPTGSIKDRIALHMIEQAEAEGALRPGKVIIEATSGNTGIGLAMIGAVKGYAVNIVMCEAVSLERRKMISAFGAKITLTAADKGTDGAILKVREMLVENPDVYFNPDQFSNRYNRLAHYEHTADEIWKQTDGKVTTIVSSLGTSGTIMGICDRIKKYNAQVQMVCAEPVKGHYIQGLKNMEEAIVPALYDQAKIDTTVMIETEDAFEMARQIVRQEGIFVGMSSGAALWAALEIAKGLKQGCIVVIFPDRGERYLSTQLFE